MTAVGTDTNTALTRHRVDASARRHGPSPDAWILPGAASAALVGLLLLLAIPGARAEEPCGRDFEACRRAARAAHDACVSACPRSGRACETQCRSALDLAIAGCVEQRDGCKVPPGGAGECHRDCDRSADRCGQRARTNSRRCDLACGRSFVADVRSCTGRLAPFALLPCLQRAFGTRQGCDGVCRSVEAHDLALCADLGAGCHDVCEPTFPDLGAYGTLANFSIRNEAHLGCRRFHPGRFPDECASPAPFERDAWQQTRSHDFLDLPWMTTRFLVRHEDARAAVTFSAIEAQNLSENHLDARSPIIVRALVDDEVIEPGEVRISYTALASGGAFTFVSGQLDEGIHIARLQWRMSDDPLSDDDPVGLLRTGTLMVRTGMLIPPEDDARTTLALASAAPEDADVILGGVDETGDWTPITESDGVTPLSVDFLVPLEAAVAITLSAEVQATHFAALDVRARLAEGGLDAGQVMFAQGLPAPLAAVVEPPPITGFASRAWTFTTTSLKPGWNTVEFDWRYRFREGLVGGEPDGIQNVAMDRRTVAVVAAPREDPYSRLEIVTPPVAPAEVEAPGDWEEIPGLTRTVTVPENAQVAVTFDGEITATNLVELRLLRDGQPVVDSEVTLTQANDAQGAFTHTWALKHLRAGSTAIGVAWRVSGNLAAGTLTTRNLVLAIEELPVPDLGVGPDVGTGAGQHANDPAAHPVEPVIGERQVLVVVVDPQRPQVHGVDVTGTADGLYSIVIHGQSHDFMASGNSPEEIRDGLIAALNTGGQPLSAEITTSNNANALASLRIIADDLGADQLDTSVSSPDDANLKLCPSGASCHNAPIPDPAQIASQLFGEQQSAVTFWDVVSGGRVRLVPAGPGIIGPYAPTHTGLEAIDHYWRGVHNCDDQSVDDVYISGHSERFAQGLLAAAASGDFDFSAYDANRDGILQERELTIVVATPQASNGGSAFLPQLSPYCNGDPVELNGVTAQGIISWYTGNGATLGDAVTISHELGHFPMGLDDMYTNADHDPDRLSIMCGTDAGYWQHLDGFQKLALGWVTPRIVRVPDDYELEDVKTGGQVLILPRLDSLGREYFLIENRQQTPYGDGGYDNQIGDSGLAVYHVLEPNDDGAFACSSDAPSWPDCLTMAPEQCSLYPFSDTSLNYVRRVVRLIRPGITLSTASLWDAGEGSLLDAAPVCPPDPAARASLVWNDGTPSGYSIDPLPAAAEMMTLPIAISP